MKDFLYEFLIEPFTDGLSGILVGLISWLFLALISFLILWGVDGLFLPTQESKGVVIGKEFIAEHDEMVGETWYSYDDEWKLYIEVDGKTDSFSLTESAYNEIQIGRVLPITYSHGRIWETVYIKQITY
jgi:hypothetical protein